MVTQVQIGVIGTSGYADAMHLTSLSTHPGARLLPSVGATGNGQRNWRANMRSPRSSPTIER
jgi:predicted dehydrogenase